VIRSNHVLTLAILFPIASLGAASCAQVLSLGDYTDGVCNPGEKRACYTGPAGTEGKGICKAGTETCEPHGQFWEKCVGSILPAASEDCDNHVDDDCNGKVNDTCGCIAGSMMACYTGAEGTEGKGICHGGMATCNEDGVGYGDCIGEQAPLAEDCSTPEDEDCDGEVNQAAAGCGCEPNKTVSCYMGAPGTENKGVCKAGTKTCNAEGTAYGPCTGETLPTAEDCSTPEDEDCDGVVNQTPPCGCEPGTSTSCYTGPAPTENVGVCKAGTKVCNADGLTYGPCTGEILPGAEDYTLPQDEDCDGFVGGQTLWARSYGDASLQLGWGVAVDPSANVLIAGQMQGAMQVGTTTLFSGGQSDIFLAKLSSAGIPQWAHAYGTPSQEYARAVATDIDGNVAIAGANPGGTPETFGCASSSPPSWATVVDTLGACAETFGCSEGLMAYSVAFDAAQNIIIAGSMSAAVTCGSSSAFYYGGGDIFVAKFQPNGTPLWLRTYGDIGAFTKQEAYAVAVDGGGNVMVTGVIYGTVGFGGTDFTDANGNGSMFLLRLNANGQHLWSKAFPNSVGTSLAVTPAGELVVTGALSGSADFGGGALTSAGMSDVVVAKFSVAGNHVWSRRFGDASAQGGVGVAVDSLGRIAVVGPLGSSIDFGGGALTASGSSEMFVANFDSAGGHRWSRAYGGASGSAVAAGCAMGPAGEIHVAGSLVGTVDFGTGSLTSAGSADVFVMKIAP
jgi:uncharacterized protein (AIM24 family)